MHMKYQCPLYRAFLITCNISMWWRDFIKECQKSINALYIGLSSLRCQGLPYALSATSINALYIGLSSLR